MSRGLHGFLRAAEQLAALQLHREASSVASGPLGKIASLQPSLQQVRGAKFHGVENAREVAAEKVKHRIAMTELRKKWAQQRLEEIQAFQKKRAEKLVIWEAKVKLMRKLKRKRQKQKAALRLKSEAMQDQLRELRSEKAAKWRQAVAQCYGQINAERKGQLEEVSRNWITPENLEERIAYALKNPSKLY